MKLRGRCDVASLVCKECGVGTTTPLATVVSDDRMYCLYKTRLYEMELQGLITLYSLTHSTKTKEDIEFYIQCSERLCDFAIERGVSVDSLYSLIEEYYSLISH